MLRIKKFMNYILLLLLALTLSGCTKYSPREEGETFIEENEYVWAIYYAPTSTQIGYGDKKSSIVFVDDKGNTINFKQRAFDGNTFEYLDGHLFYSSKLGVEAFNLDIDKDKPEDLSFAYTHSQSGVMDEKNLYYFHFYCSQEQEFRNNPSSCLILGNSNKHKIYYIGNFAYGLGADEDHIYIMAEHENHKDMIIRKYEVKETGDLVQKLEKTIKAKDGYLSYQPHVSYMVIDDSLYAYASLNNNNYENRDTKYFMLKFSTDTLHLESETYLFETTDTDGFESYRNEPTSSKAVFNVDKTIYIVTANGRVFSYDVDKNDFKEVFKIDNSVYKTFIDGVHFYEDTNDISFLYSDENASKFYIAIYSLEGKLKELISFDKPVHHNGYPHAFIRIK